MLLPAFLALASLALADPRVFAARGTQACQACLSDVEEKCRGPTSSEQFNNCFCSIGTEGLAWPALAKCVSGQDAKCPANIQYDILGDWGAHCFAYKKDEEEQVCVDSTQNDKLLMSVADVFCTEFLTLTTSSTSATATANATLATTTSGTSAVTTSTGTQISNPLTTPAPTRTTADPKASAGASGSANGASGGGSSTTKPAAASGTNAAIGLQVPFAGAALVAGVYALL